MFEKKKVLFPIEWCASDPLIRFVKYSFHNSDRPTLVCCVLMCSVHISILSMETNFYLKIKEHLSWEKYVGSPYWPYVSVNTSCLAISGFKVCFFFIVFSSTPSIKSWSSYTHNSSFPLTLLPESSFMVQCQSSAGLNAKKLIGKPEHQEHALWECIIKPPCAQKRLLKETVPHSYLSTLLDSIQDLAATEGQKRRKRTSHVTWPDWNHQGTSYVYRILNKT